MSEIARKSKYYFKYLPIKIGTDRMGKSKDFAT